MLDSFYHKHSGKVAVCEECGRKLYETLPINIAHILPKAIFKSVATNDNNFIYLCWEHHSQFDSSWANAQKMKCWNKALEKYNLFKDDIIEKHKILTFFNTQ